MINLSISISEGYSTIFIQNNGKEIYKETFPTEEKEEHYTFQYLELFRLSLWKLKTVLEQKRISYEELVVIEMKCKQVVQWFNELKCPKNHSKKFIETLKVFDMIPNRYKIVSTKVPVASFYAERKVKETYSTIYDLG